MTMSSDEKVVQTTLRREEYDLLCSVAEDEGMSIKETLRDAATQYARARSRPDPDDPLFAYEPDGSTGESLSATRTDEYLYDED